MDYALKTPVEFGKKKISSVTIKENWLAGDYIEIQNAGDGATNAGDRACRQVSLAIDMPDPFVKLLSIPDYVEILKISNNFFTKPTKNSKENS